MLANPSKAQLLENLRVMLRDAIRLRAAGVAYARLARAHGYVDGYMRVLLETGVADSRELLQVVAEERRAVDGPPSRELSVETTLDGASVAA
jgi:hypothetical protein